ncbi:retrovirus-related pol polyprotein from transposon TNT 1-94, partial [Tanacetum coccineum]
VDNTAKTRRPYPRSNTKNDMVPSASKSSHIKNREVKVEEHHRNLLLSKNKKHMLYEYNNIKLAIRNDKSEVMCAMCKQCLITANHDVCVLNYVNDMNSHGKKQKANVLNTENQKKQKPKVKKPKKVGSNKRLASPKTSKTRSCLRWSPTGRIFDLKGNIIESSESASQYDFSNDDNACISNPQEPIRKQFLNSTFSLAGHSILFMFLGTVCFGNDHVTIILGYGDLQWGNILITRVYFVEGLGHNLFLVGQFCDSDLEARATSTKKWALCYPKNDREDFRKLGAKGDIGFFIGYFANSCAYRVYNRRTKKIMETMNVKFDELSAIAFEQSSAKPGLQSMTSRQINSGLDLTYAPSTITTQQPTESELDLLFEAMYDDYIGGQPSAASRTTLAAQAPPVLQTSTTFTTIADTAPTLTNSSSQATNIPNTLQDVDELETQQHHVQQQAPLHTEFVADNVPNAMFDGNTFVNPFATPSTNGDMCMYALIVSIMKPKNVKEAITDPAWIKSMQEELLQFKRLDVWVLVPAPDYIKPLTLKWLFKNKHDEENTVIQNKTRLVVRG